MFHQWTVFFSFQSHSEVFFAVIDHHVKSQTFWVSVRWDFPNVIVPNVDLSFVFEHWQKELIVFGETHVNNAVLQSEWFEQIVVDDWPNVKFFIMTWK